MPLYGYNYPWSGRVGRIAKQCIYCGDDGPSFQISSSAVSCLKCIREDLEPIPELLKKYQEKAEIAIREWCDKHNIDYEATVANYEKNLGPPLQERDSPIPDADKDYTVYRE